MNPKRKTSSDEVRVEIKDSERSGNRYWNLRDKKKYNYSRETKSSKRNSDDEINVEFNLNENRRLTEEQKQTILNTLLSEQGKKEHKRDEPQNFNFSNPWKLLVLLLLLGGIVTAVVLANSSC